MLIARLLGAPRPTKQRALRRYCRRGSAIYAASGLEVQKELQAISPKTRVIISTANDHDSVRNTAIQAGAIAYFVKPFDDDAFLAAVHQAMASES